MFGSYWEIVSDWFKYCPLKPCIDQSFRKYMDIQVPDEPHTYAYCISAEIKQYGSACFFF